MFCVTELAISAKGGTVLLLALGVASERGKGLVQYFWRSWRGGIFRGAGLLTLLSTPRGHGGLNSLHGAEFVGEVAGKKCSERIFGPIDRAL
jgi:hypothetical protein